MSPSRYISIICSLLSFSLATQLFSNATIPGNLTTECSAALLADVQCSSVVAVLRPGIYYPNATLQRTCTNDCSSSLGQYARKVSDSCGDQTWTGFGDTTMPVSVIADVMQYHFDRVCMTDSGRYCNDVAAQAALTTDFSPTEADAIDNSTRTTLIDPCDLCLIKNLQFQAASPYYDGPELGTIYESKTASCQIKSMPITSAPTLSFTLPPAASPTAQQCIGTSYDIKPGDDCSSIATSQNISTGWLLMDNNLSAFCANFPKNGTLCIRDTCQTYTIKQGDKCSGISAMHNITQSQLVAWNPSIANGCVNIEKLNETTICVSPPGALDLRPSPAITTPTMSVTPAAVPSNAREGSSRDCARWYEVMPYDYCNLLVLKFGIALDDFVFLNPTINSNCTNLMLGISYCVQAVGDINTYSGRTGSRPTISPVTSFQPFAELPTATTVMSISRPSVKPFAAGSRQDCATIFDGSIFQDQVPYYKSICAFAASTLSVNLVDFGTWNSKLNVSDPSCSFTPGLQYCGKYYIDDQITEQDDSPVYPVRNGTIANCATLDDAVDGQTCQDFLTDHDLAMEQFYAWNPAVGSDCSTYSPDYSYCVNGSGTNTTSNLTTSTTTPPVSSG